jgi:hypothetical protein
MALESYRYLLADLLTNEIIAELPFTGVSFTKQLNQAGTWSGHLLLSGLDSAAFNVEASTIPTRNALYVDYDGTLVWGGIIWGRSYSNSSQVLTIQAREFESYFERRRIVTSQIFTATDQLTIARNLISLAQSSPYGDIGVQMGVETSGVLLSREYYSYEGKNYFNALQDLSRAENGFDFTIEASYDGSNTPIKTLILGYPRTGTVYSASDPYAIMFELPGNIVDYEYPEDGAIAANTVYALGAGSNEGKLIAVATDSTKTIAGYPLLEEAANYSDVTDQTYLGQLALGQVNAISYPPTTMRVVIPADDTPSLNDYSLGDDARIRITDNRFPNTLDAVYRIVGITVTPGEDGPERVTLTLTNTSN